MKYDVITIGGATEDITFYTKEGMLIDNKKDILRQKLLAFEFGAKLKVDQSYSTFGGGAANTAVCLSRLGLRVAAMVAIGNNSRGDHIANNLKNQGVNIQLIQKKGDIESGFSFLLVGQSNEHIVFSNRAANTKLSIGEKEKRNLKQTEWIYMTSLSGNWGDVLKNIFSVGGPKIAWNPGHIQLHKGVNTIGKYLKKTEFLIVNKDEAMELVVSDLEYRGRNHKFLNNIKNLLTIIKSWGPKIVIITNGKYGADAYDGETFYHQDVIKEKKRLDTTGVGDAFGSSFIAGLIMYGGDIKKAMFLGAKNTASVIGQQGAQNGLLTKKDV